MEAGMLFFTANRVARRRISRRVVWVLVLLLGSGALAVFGWAESGVPVPTVAAQAAAARVGEETSAQSDVAAVAATIRGLTAVITAVSRSWWWPIEAGLELMQDTVHRGWSAIRRLPGQDRARP
jgi:hypothetical protein